MLSKGTKLYSKDAMYSTRNLLSFKDFLHLNGYQIEATNEGDIEYLQVSSIDSVQKLVLEMLPTFFSRLYCTTTMTI